MKKYLFILAAAATVLAACTKELKEISSENAEVLDPSKTYIEAFCEEGIDGKAFINDTSAAFTWSTGDQIAVFSGSTYYISDELGAAYNNKATAAFSFADDINAGRSDFAVYPAALVHNGTSPITASVNKHTAAALSVKFPKNYELAQLQGEQSPAPRIAVNAPGQGLQFKSICAILRIKVRDVAKFCDYITIQFPGKKVNGEFVMNDFVAGTAGVSLVASSKESEEVITVTELGCNKLYFADSLILNIPVPMGVAGSMEYDNIIVTAWDEDGMVINKIEVPIKEVASVPTAWAPGRKSARKVDAPLPAFTVSGSNIKSATKKVLFAPGNLRAVVDTPPTATERMGTASSWFFAPHQYDALKDDPANLLQAESKKGDVIDLFAWVGTGQSKTYTDEQKFGLYYISSGNGSWVGQGGGATLLRDWGENIIKFGDDITYPANTWRTPKGDEWAFVLESRKNKNGTLIVHGAKATIIRAAGDTLAFGLIILPDFFKCPYGVQTLVKCYPEGAKNYTSNREPAGAVCRDNVYNLEDWAKLEAAGCVFLPLCNHRYTSSNKANLIYPGDAYYWSSTSNAGDSNTYALAFNDPAVGASKFNASVAHWQSKKSKARNDGCAVRLVRDLN